jgi:hypothetical protein
MGGIDQTRANAILAAYGKNSGTATVGTETITGPMHLRLMTTTTLSGDVTLGSELATSGGYTAGGAAISFGTASAGTIASNAAVTWTNMPSATLSGIEEWDTSATPLRTFWTAWNTGNIVVASGSTLTVASGSLTNALQ